MKTSISLFSVFFIFIGITAAQPIFGEIHVIDNNADARELQYADLNGDGIDDLVALLSNFVVVYYGIGDGNFEGKETLIAFSGSNISMFVLDFDNDQITDILLQRSGLKFYKNDGAGNFQSPVTIFTGGTDDLFHAYDIDGDGDGDVIEMINDDSYWTITFYENLGSGNFSDGDVIFQDWGTSMFLYFEDISDNGHIDIAMAQSRDYLEDPWVKVKLAINNNNNYGYFNMIKYYNDYYFHTRIKFADFNGDSDCDILIDNPAGVTWMENDGSNDFDVSHDIAGAWNPKAVFDADMDNDIDIIHGSLYWIENDGNGNFINSYFINEINSSWNSPFKAFDANSDTDLDIFFSANNEISWVEDLSIQTVVVDRQNSPVSIYPNPVQGYLFIEGDGIYTCEVYGFTGKKLFTGKSPKIDLSSFENGIYFLKVKSSSGETVINQKIIVQH